MPKFIIKISDEKTNKDYYLEWSTVVDSPVTKGFSLEEFKEYYKDQYGNHGVLELKDRLKRVEETGTSAHGETLEDVISYNVAGKNDECLTKQEILEQYCLNQ